MIANLSLVLDELGKIRLDLINNQNLSEIDKYTTVNSSSREVRVLFQDKINDYLEENKEYISSFRRECNRQGRIVITYLDSGYLHMLKVLYKSQAKKTNFEWTLKKIISSLNKSSLEEVFMLIEHFTPQIFGSVYDRKEIYYTRRKLNQGNKEALKRRIIERIIKNHLLNTSQTSFEKAYYYLRIIDSYLEKRNIFIIPKGEVATTSLVPQHKLKIVRKTPYPIYEEESGQYSFVKVKEYSSKI